ncbi:FAM72 protein-domain-containing protein [Gongronella butleri]|nr:FAM72 protein-domain-containing protein [Gongronella butleri]
MTHFSLNAAQAPPPNFVPYTRAVSSPNTAATTTTAHSHRPHIQADVVPIKLVYRLSCRHCEKNVCTRGMKAILLADMKVELYSTDTPSSTIHLMDKDYLTRTCHCRIRDVACLECGNIIGYHVVSPCRQCLSACNNGHFWMFHADACLAIERKDETGREFLVWSNLPRADKDHAFLKEKASSYDQILR